MASAQGDMESESPVEVWAIKLWGADRALIEY